MEERKTPSIEEIMAIIDEKIKWLEEEERLEKEAFAAVINVLKEMNINYTADTNRKLVRFCDNFNGLMINIDIAIRNEALELHAVFPQKVSSSLLGIVALLVVDLNGGDKPYRIDLEKMSGTITWETSIVLGNVDMFSRERFNDICNTFIKSILPSYIEIGEIIGGTLPKDIKLYEEILARSLATIRGMKDDTIGYGCEYLMGKEGKEN